MSLNNRLHQIDVLFLISLNILERIFYFAYLQVLIFPVSVRFLF